jgi:hypothetical protein
MQGNRLRATGERSKACTAWLVAGAIAPFGGLIALPFAIVGAIVVLFAFVVAAVEVRH